MLEYSLREKRLFSEEKQSEIILTRQEANILIALAENPDKVMSRPLLCRHLRSKATCNEDNVLKVVVWRLRKKLTYIGYRFAIETEKPGYVWREKVGLKVFKDFKVSK